MSLNKVMVIGHLGQDPEIRYTPAGMPVVNFSVATDEAYLDKDGKRQERAEWHRVVVAGKLALVCREYLKRGRQVFVEGRLRTREWESNGATNRRTEIVASRRLTRMQTTCPPIRPSLMLARFQFDYLELAGVAAARNTDRSVPRYSSVGR
jgi:single stranded DNA-binding protein